MIRLDAGMPTSRYCRMLGIPERSYRRWQARARQQRKPLGPWPRPVSVRVEAELVRLAGRWPAWGHRILAQIGRLDHGLAVSDSTAYRVLDRAGLCLPVDYTRERRDLAAARRAAFVEPPTRPHQVWQLDFTEYETTQGGVWRAAGCADYFTKYEYGWQISTTQNQHDAINAVEIAIREAERLSGRPLAETLIDPVTGEIKPIRLVTDNGPAFRLRALSHEPAGTRAHPHPARLTGPERRARASFPQPQVRAALPARDPRRRDPRAACRRLPRSVQLDPPPPRHQHAPTRRLSSRQPQPKTARNLPLS